MFVDPENNSRLPFFETFQDENKIEPTSKNQQNPQECLVLESKMDENKTIPAIEKFLDENQNKPTNIDQHHQKSQVLDSEIESYIKNISWIIDKQKSKNIKNQISEILQNLDIDDSKKVITWFILNQIDPNYLQWIDDRGKQSLNDQKDKFNKIKKKYEQNDQFKMELIIKILVLDTLTQQLADMIKQELLNLEVNELKITFEVIEFYFEKDKENFIFNNRFYCDLAFLFVKNIYTENNNLKILETIKSNELIYLRKYLKKIEEEDIISPKGKPNLIGLIFWIFPFADQILDVIYLITGKFCHPSLFYLFLASFCLSLIVIIANAFYAEFKKSKQRKMSVSTPKSNTSFLLIKLLFISICSWLKIDDLVYLLGLKKTFRNLFKSQDKIFYMNGKFLYNDNDEILKEQRKIQKIETYFENIPHFFILVINQTLLRDWKILNLFQSSITFALSSISIFYLKFQDNNTKVDLFLNIENNLNMDSFMDIVNYILIKFSYVHYGLVVVYALTVLCVDIIAQKQLDLLDSSSDLAQFQSKFRSQIIFISVMIVIDLIYQLIFIFKFKGQLDKDFFQGFQHHSNKNISKLIPMFILFIVTLIYSCLKIVYSYFEISMYYAFYTELSEADRFELFIIIFRFSYLMLIIFIASHFILPFPYLVINLIVLIIVVLFILIGIIVLILKFIINIFKFIKQKILKCFGVDSYSPKVGQYQR